MYRTILPLVLLTICLSPTLVHAGPADLGCQAAITRLSQEQKRMQDQQVKVDRAARDKQVVASEAAICQPGGIITGGTITECRRIRQNLPIATRTLADAQNAFQAGVVDFRARIDAVIRACE